MELSKELLQQIIDVLPVHIYLADKNTKVVGANINQAINFGCKDVQDCIGKDTYDFAKLLGWSKETVDQLHQEHLDIIKTGKGKVTEHTFKLVDGKTHTYLSHKYPLIVNGEVIGFTGVSIDITDRKKLEKLEKLEIEKKAAEKNALSSELLKKIINTLPAHIYWTDKDTRIIGTNLSQAINFGYNDVESCIGKDTYDFAKHLGWDKKFADQVHQEHLDIIKTGKGKTLEHTVTLADGKEHNYLSYKYPLIINGEITGFVGISVYITDRKRAEKLEIDKAAAEKTAKTSEALLREQEKFRTFAAQVAHDIRSPLASLLMIVKSCEKELPEETRIALRETAVSIGEIANNLLNRYKTNTGEEPDKAVEKLESIIITPVLFQLITDKKYQYKNSPITFEFNPSADCSFLFINAKLASFKRMISNLINNSVDALESKKGKITLKLEQEQESIVIIIQDNGKGMVKEIINKIMSDMAISNDKKEGHGIGLIQVRETLKQINGKMTISSKIGKGTKTILTFPKAAAPSWIAKEIKLHKGDIVVILDDDASIHGAWKTRFKDYLQDICLKHFTLGKEAIDFINSSTTKDKIFLLTDFELLEQELNGLHVIEKTSVKRSVLVTSHYANQVVQSLAAKTGTKILPKQLASEIPIKTEKMKREIAHNSKKIDIVVIDDNKTFVNSLAHLLETKNKTVDTYYEPACFLEKISQYAKNTLICMDHNLSPTMNGIDLAKQLHAAGYSNLYLLSGDNFGIGEVPSYLQVILKTNIEDFLKIVVE